MKRIINCETGEVVERELTDEELAQQVEDEKVIAEIQAEAEAKAAARQAILDRLGLTKDEAKLLLG
jgi:adenylate kinase